MQRRQKGAPISFLRMFGFCTLGAIGLSLLVQPLAIMASAGDLKKVEDPQHLARLLQSAKDERFARRPDMPRPNAPGQDMQPQGRPMPDIPSTRMTTRPASSNAGQQTNQWGDDLGAAEMSSSNDFASAPSPDQLPSTSGSQARSQPEQYGSSSSEPEQSQSRWSQLRGERGVKESSWDRIRQQNARESYNRQAASGQGQPGQPAYTQTSMGEGNYSRQGGGYGGQSGSSSSSMYGQQQSSELADPTFGKGVSSARAQAQREYERSFEKERRGIDG